MISYGSNIFVCGKKALESCQNYVVCETRWASLVRRYKKDWIKREGKEKNKESEKKKNYKKRVENTRVILAALNKFSVWLVNLTNWPWLIMASSKVLKYAKLNDMKKGTSSTAIMYLSQLFLSTLQASVTKGSARIKSNMREIHKDQIDYSIVISFHTHLAWPVSTHPTNCYGIYRNVV